jgi:hypothetical protein
MSVRRHTDEAAEETAETVIARRRRRIRVVQIALGCVWILDAALQFQPRMFSDGLVNQMMLPMAQGQPAPIGWSITHLANFIHPDVGVWNFFFGAIQLAIGVGMLFRRTVKPAIVVMAVWALGVWWFGEGFGMLLTGAASPLTGAPGAVLLYPVIGLLVWPRGRDEPTGREEPAGREQRDEQLTPGLRSSAAAAGPFGSNAALVAWSGFWTLSAILWLFPANRANGSISSALTTAASGEPSWLARYETSIAHALPQTGPALPWLLALVSLVVAAAPLVTRRPRPFLLLGVGVEALYWVTGMAFGGMLTGMGTDPNVAPLIGLLAFAMWPLVRTVPAESPARELAGRHPVAGLATTAAALAVLVLSSTYPVATASASASASTSHSQSSRSSTAGMAGMAMPGASSATAARGHTVGNADPAWRYTGPALPAQEVSVLTRVFDETEKGHAMQTPSCDKAPTAAQLQSAMQLVQTTSAAVAPFKNINVAKADGYFPITDPHYPVVHYLNPGYMNSKDVLDPDHVQSLVYAFTPYGPVLAAAMYLMPSAGEAGPMPGGCLTQWHAHTNLCIGGRSGTISGFQNQGSCPAGETPLLTPEMMHVWQVPVPGGPLTMDPTDQQVVEAAIMAQQDGRAPVTPGATVPAITGSFGT